VRNFDQELLERHCDAIVERGNFLKFSQNERLKETLLGTGYRAIVETSPNDRFWGIGYDTESAEGSTENWDKNGLGEALMGVQEMLRKEA
jgi:ribA/ribD-fused uncharacterized protein